MSNINELKNEIGQKTVIMFLLWAVTGGLYLLIWLTDRYKIFNNILGKKILSIKFIIWIAVFTGIGHAFLITGFIDIYETGDFTTYLFGLMSYMISYIFYIISAFKLSKGMSEYCTKEFKVNLKFNKLYLLSWNIFYINYYINALEEITEEIAEEIIQQQELLSS